MDMKKLAVSAAIAAFAAALPAAPASAASTQSTTFLVKANVDANCTIDAADLDFGTYDPTGNLDASSQISITCTNATAWNVGLNEGSFAGATVTSRKMTGPSSFALAYSLFTDSARTQNWGNTVGTDTVSGTGTGAADAVTVFGRIPASQNVGAGSYQDTVTATITF
jgi:spore coat protein U-like protein